MPKLYGFLPVVLVSALCFTGAARAETPCDFKGISVGDQMTPAHLMTALGVTKYKTNPVRPSFEDQLAASEKYSMIVAAEMEDWQIGPYCGETYCRIPYGVTVGNENTPVNLFVSFHEGLITEIDVTFGESYWDEMLPIFDQKYGADWTVEHNDMPITDYVTKETTLQERVTIAHKTNGVNARTKDRCEIWATNFDIVFEHHDGLGPYHSQFVIRLVSKNF